MVSDVLARFAMRSRILLTICTILIVAACGREKQDNESWLDPAASSTTTMPPPATMPEVAAGTTVLVTINDGHIATREASIPPGPAVLTVANAGKELHGLHVEGPNVQAALDEPIAAGGSGTIAVTFERGTYTFYCPVLDHREKGETLTVPIPTS